MGAVGPIPSERTLLVSAITGLALITTSALVYVDAIDRTSDLEAVGWAVSIFFVGGYDPMLGLVLVSGYLLRRHSDEAATA